MWLRRELRALGGFVLGLLGFFLAYVHRGDALVAPFALVGAALLLGAALAISERPRGGGPAPPRGGPPPPPPPHTCHLASPPGSNTHIPRP